MERKREKSRQVRTLEEKLGRPLAVSDDESIMGSEYRKCCKVDEDREIVGLNLFGCKVSDWSFLTSLTRLTPLSTCVTTRFEPVHDNRGSRFHAK